MALALLSIGLMTVDHRSDNLHSVRSILSLLVYPIHYAVNFPVELGHWTLQQLVSRRHLLEEIRRLQSKQLMLDAKLQRLAAIEHENSHLRQLLASTSAVKQKHILIAEILSVALDPYKQQILINKGERDGVQSGLPLLDAHGVFGQVTQVTPFSATAILISDPSHALPVQVLRTGLRTLIVGTGNADSLSVRYIPASADIKVGDVVSTSGLGGRFPADYPVASISSIERSPGEPFATVNAKPLADLDRSRELVLVWPDSPQALTAAVTASQPRHVLATNE